MLECKIFTQVGSCVPCGLERSWHLHSLDRHCQVAHYDHDDHDDYSDDDDYDHDYHEDDDYDHDGDDTTWNIIARWHHQNVSLVITLTLTLNVVW